MHYSPSKMWSSKVSSDAYPSVDLIAQQIMAASAIVPPQLSLGRGRHFLLRGWKSSLSWCECGNPVAHGGLFPLKIPQEKEGEVKISP